MPSVTEDMVEVGRGERAHCAAYDVRKAFPCVALYLFL